MDVGHDLPVLPELDAGAGQPGRGGTCADADDDRARGQPRAVVEDDLAGFDALHARVGAQFDAGVGVPGGHRRGHLGRQRTGERPLGRLDDRHRAARLARGRGELGTDPARADDHDVVLAGEHGPQPLGVVQGAQQMHSGHAFGARQTDRFGAGGEDQDVVRDGSGLGVQFVRAGAQAHHLAAEAQFDGERLEVDLEGGALGLAEQDRLGQRGPVVGLVGLGADQGHAAGKAPFPQGDRGLHAGHARAHHDHAPQGRPARFPRLLAHLITIDN